MYYFAAAGAVARGYNCLTFDGPGQGLPVREQNLRFRYDWEKVVSPAVDYALTRGDVDREKLALIGMSLGGYFGARAAAFEPRFKAAIFYDGVYSLFENVRLTIPKDAFAAFEAGDLVRCDELIQKAMQRDTSLRWEVDNGVWTFGASGFADFVERTKKYTLDGGVAEKIQCPCLVMEAEKDIFFAGQPQKVYDALKAPKLLFRVTDEFGAENHCQSGELSYKDEVGFNWLDETLKLHDSR